MGKSAPGMRLNAGKLMEAMRSSGDRRRAAGDELLWGKKKVTVGGTNQSGKRSRKGLVRCAFSPGSCCRSWTARRRCGAAGIDDGRRRPEKGNGEPAVDSRAPGLIPRTRR
jgi:hypothetical protein